MRLVVLACLATLVAASATAAANPYRATMSTSSTKPITGLPWRYTITVRDPAGKPAVARVRLQTLRGNVVVGCWKGARMTRCSRVDTGAWIRFTGTRRGALIWPAQRVGIRVTFQATVVTGTRTLRLRAPVTVRPAV